MPAEALRRTQASLAYFERLEVWHAVGMADPWLVGGVRLPSRRGRVYLFYDWGTETTAERQGPRWTPGGGEPFTPPPGPAPLRPGRLGVRGISPPGGGP